MQEQGSRPGVRRLRKEDPAAPGDEGSELGREPFGVRLPRRQVGLDLPGAQRLGRRGSDGGDAQAGRQGAAGQRQEGLDGVGGGEGQPVVEGQLGGGPLQRPWIAGRDDLQQRQQLDPGAGPLEGGGEAVRLVLGAGDDDAEAG